MFLPTSATIFLLPLFILIFLDARGQKDQLNTQRIQSSAIERYLTRADSLAAEFKQPDYERHFQSHELLIDEQAAAIPALIPLLSDTSYQRLINTSDLIYPGATNYYGHGYIVPYELDWVAVRAGWLLEELTFENFGYTDSPVSEDSLLAYDLHDNSAYLLSGHRFVKLSSSDKVQYNMKLVNLAKTVEAWWEENRGEWTRLRALKNALESADHIRQMNALSYLRYATTNCDDLSEDSFQTSLFPAIQNLTYSEYEDVSSQARQLIADGFSWMYKDFRYRLRK